MSTWRDNPLADARLAKLANARHSASQIARMINHEFGLSITRNAVIGRVNRRRIQLHGGSLGDKESRESKRQESLLRQRMRQSEREAAQAAKAREAAERARLRVEAKNPWRVVETALPLAQRPAGSCAWPVGEPTRPAEQLCCGAPRAGGSSYCPTHRAVGTTATVTAMSLMKSVGRYL